MRFSRKQTACVGWLYTVAFPAFVLIALFDLGYRHPLHERWIVGLMGCFCGLVGAWLIRNLAQEVSR